MTTVFLHSLKKYRGAILGWGLTLAIVAMIFVPFYDSIAENAEQFQQMIELYPEELMAFFTGGGNFNFTTPEGFLAIEYFSFMPLVIGVFAIMAGSGLLAADEERGVLDLEAAQPVSRSTLFWGRLSSLVVSLFFILVLGYAGVMAGTTYSQMDLDAVDTITPFASLFAYLLFFAGLALLLSMLLPSRSSASMAAGIVLVASFLLAGLSQFNDTLASIEPFLANMYYQGTDWTEGFKLDWFLILAGLGFLFILLAWWAFLRRDIRVGGEGGWKLPWFQRRATAKVQAN
ncbi:MAG TPA: ABC transporter permease subunit [Anaerolineales bacterium]|nr:ABC transporter permease subunit [Anaerolineales bacterium]